MGLVEILLVRDAGVVEVWSYGRVVLWFMASRKNIRWVACMRRSLTVSGGCRMRKLYGVGTRNICKVEEY